MSNTAWLIDTDTQALCLVGEEVRVMARDAGTSEIELSDNVYNTDTDNRWPATPGMRKALARLEVGL